MQQTACEQTPAPEPVTATTFPVTEPSVAPSVEPSVEPTIEPSVEPEPIYTVADCFAENATIIDTMDAFTSYLNSFDGLTVRAYATRRTYPSTDSADVDNSTVENVFSYVTYAGIDKAIIDDTEVDTFLTQTKDELTKASLSFTDAYGIELSTEPTFAEICKAVINGCGMDLYCNNMFISADTVITEEDMQNALADGSYRVFSDLPSEVIMQILEPDVTTNEIVMAECFYDLMSDYKEEPTVFPTYLSGMVQYVNDNNQMTVYSLSIAIVPSSYEDIEGSLIKPCSDAPEAYTFTELDVTKYAKTTMNIRNLPSTDGNVVGQLAQNEAVHVTGQCVETNWYRIEYQDGVAYGSANYLVDTKVDTTVATTTTVSDPDHPATAPNGNVLDWSQPNPNMPGMYYAEDGYLMYQIIDNGGDDICFYSPSYFTGLSDSTHFGQLQRQMDELWESRGHTTHAWHAEILPNGVSRSYLTD